VSTVPIIGFDRRLELRWLEQAASLALLGTPSTEIRRLLADMLASEAADPAQGREGREKTLRLLMRIWVTPREEVARLRQEGLSHLRRLPSEQHLPLHWGMTSAAYPFFAHVTAAAGRLLSLQDTVGAAQVQRRLQEQLGDRQFVSRPARHALRTLVGWDLLAETGEKGLYRTGVGHKVDEDVAGWLVEIILQGGPPRPLQSLSRDPALFPFAIPPLQATRLAGRAGLRTFRQGLDEDVIASAG